MSERGEDAGRWNGKGKQNGSGKQGPVRDRFGSHRPIPGKGIPAGDGAIRQGPYLDWLARRGDEETGQALDQKWREVRSAVGSGMNWRHFSEIVLQLTKMLYRAHR